MHSPGQLRGPGQQALCCSDSIPVSCGRPCFKAWPVSGGAAVELEDAAHSCMVSCRWPQALQSCEYHLR